jgi:hypothetical protein
MFLSHGVDKSLIQKGSCEEMFNFDMCHIVGGRASLACPGREERAFVGLTPIYEKYGRVE